MKRIFTVTLIRMYGSVIIKKVNYFPVWGILAQVCPFIKKLSSASVIKFFLLQHKVDKEKTHNLYLQISFLRLSNMWRKYFLSFFLPFSIASENYEHIFLSMWLFAEAKKMDSSLNMVWLSNAVTTKTIKTTSE